MSKEIDWACGSNPTYLSTASTKHWLNKPMTPIQNAVTLNSVSSLGLNTEVINNNPFLFNNQLDYNLPITNQKSSGRCWLFATCNLIRMVGFNNLEKQYGKIEDFELSQSYLYFWDKLERYHRNLRYYIQINNISDTI